MIQELDSIDGFVSTKNLISPWGLIAIDDNSRQIAIKEKDGELKLYPYSGILSCEIIEDGETTYKKSSSYINRSKSSRELYTRLTFLL